MSFNKLILGENELHDFENLLLRDRIITKMNTEYSPAAGSPIISKGTRNTNKARLLKAIMVFDKIDAVDLSPYDVSPLVDCGLVEENACISHGSDSVLSSRVVDSAWKYKNQIIESIISITNSLFRANRIDVYPKSLISQEELLDLCDAYLYGSQRDFLSAYNNAMELILQHYFRFNSDYNRALERIWDSVYDNIDKIYDVLDSVPYEKDLIPTYLNLFEELQSSIQKYYVSHICLDCKSDWMKCCDNSEFMYTYNFSCPFREELGEQRFAKINGLILSSENNAVLFDNSIQFLNSIRNSSDSLKLIDDIYHIVNIDLSNILESLPTPRNAREAIRIRNRPEISSFRNILFHWGESLSTGDIDTAEQIQKDFDEAKKYFIKKEKNNITKRSIFHCFFEALGSQIPYLSNVVGFITPFLTRKKLLEEEKHRWFLLTR